ncbi:MAG: ABC transporter substrate-binding protein, partial [Bullifex sp.]
MKKLTLVFAVLLISVTVLFAQGATEEAKAEETFVFTDDLGREVTLPVQIDRVAPSGSMASACLLAFDPDLFVGVTSKPTTVETEFFGSAYASLPVLGTFYGKKANLNREALIVAAPQVVMDVGEIKGSTADMIDDLDKLSADIGIPVIFIESYLKGIGNTFSRMGEALHREERGNELAAFAQDAVDYALSIASKVTDPADFYYATNQDGLGAIPRGNFHAEVLETVGGNNVVDTTISSGNNQISLEELYKQNVEMIFVLEESAYDAITTKSEWSYLSAVQTGKVYKVPNVLFPMIDAPPSVNRIIGIYYAASKLYPELNTEDFLAKAEEFYSLFYGHTLTEA